MRTGEPQFVPDIRRDSRFGYPDHACAAGWVSMLGYPIKLAGHTRGVIEVFTFEHHNFGQAELDTVRRLADMAGITIENTSRLRESEKLADVAQTLSAIPDFDRAMQVIVKSAQDLTGADSSTIVLLEEQTDSFIVGKRIPPEGPPSVIPRDEGGLTREIIKAGKPIKVDDTKRDSRVSAALVREGIRSVVGVRVQMADESIGVLFVDGRRETQFTEHDVRALQILADQASVALGWRRLLLKPWSEIEQTTSQLFHLDSVLDNICCEIHSSLDFEFVAVQLKRSEENVVETALGFGIAEAWSGLAKHYLDEDPELQDIQTDIVRADPPRMEILAGWDKRFDKWIYDEYHHERLIRVFAPIVLVRDVRGKIVEDGFKYCQWEVMVEEEHDERRRIVLEMRLSDLLPGNGEPMIEFLGTVEAGYRDPQRRISPEQARELARLVAGRALDVDACCYPMC